MFGCENLGQGNGGRSPDYSVNAIIASGQLMPGGLAPVDDPDIVFTSSQNKIIIHNIGGSNKEVDIASTSLNGTVIRVDRLHLVKKLDRPFLMPTSAASSFITRSKIGWSSGADGLSYFRVGSEPQADTVVHYIFNSSPSNYLAFEFEVWQQSPYENKLQHQAGGYWALRPQGRVAVHGSPASYKVKVIPKIVFIEPN